MLLLKPRKIIGMILILILLLQQAQSACAFYSPFLNQQATLIKQHMLTASTVTGVGTLAQFQDKMKELGKEGNEGVTNLFWGSIKDIIIQSVTESFLDGLSLLFGRWIGTNEWISNCLRDDIWELEALKEQVLDQMLKSAFLSDLVNASIMSFDFKTLNAIMSDGYPVTVGTETKYISLKKDYKNRDYSKIWFPKSKNYYIECPYGEFTKAWKDLKRAIDSFKNIGSGNLILGSFADMAVVAQIRAIKRAEQWIKANQITLTIGGSQGSSPRSLIQGPGLNGLVADLKTEFNYAAKYADLIFTNTWRGLTGQGATGTSQSTNPLLYSLAYQQAQAAKQLALKQMTNASTFNLTFSNVSENVLIAVAQSLNDTNETIKSAVDTTVTKANLKTFCDKLLIVLKKQCPNRGAGSSLSCNK